MNSLGISTLFAQKMGAETAESKKLSRTDSDSLLVVVSRDLESMLQTAFEMAAAYVGKEAPLVRLDRDFDLQTLDGNQVGQYLQLVYQQHSGITLETLLGALKKGEILPDIDVEGRSGTGKPREADNIVMQQAPAEAAAVQIESDVKAASIDDDVREGFSRTDAWLYCQPRAAKRG